MKKFIRNLIIIVYAAVAIGVTICLLLYNEYKVSEFGNYSLVIINNNDLSPDFIKGDLVIIDRSKKIEVGEEAFFYNTYAKEIAISKTKIINAEEVTEIETTYTLDGGKLLSSQYIIGPVSASVKYSKIGTALGIIESKWGFLLLIVLPSLIAFLYEIAAVIMEFKGGKKEETGKRRRHVE